MFQRNALSTLHKWAAKDSRKPLILRGARQVGKTTLVNEFSKEFDTYLYLNLEDELAVKLFDTPKNIHDVLVSIYLYCNKPKKTGRTLLFIDEIQNSVKAVALLRYFHESIPELYVVAAGSLLESLIDTHISFPVGRVEYMAVRPCTFDEFLGALGETELQQAISQTAIPESIHEKAMGLFNTYTLIGGMPEVVRHYALHKDLVAINDIYESLLSGYSDDVEKYTQNTTMTHVIRYILQTGWSFAAQNITLGSFAGSSYKSREMSAAFRTLEKTMLLDLVYPTVGVTIPIIPELRRSPKLLWLDVGLVNYSSKLQKEVFGSKDILDAWRGHIAEQVVAQELLASDYRVSHRRNFWVREKKGSDAEIDFVVQHDNRIIPIEVKSGHNAKLKSLQIFMEQTNHHTAVRVWSKPLSIDAIQTQSGKKFTLINVPFYYIGILDSILADAETRKS
jgi:uncharacterized protein